MVKRLQCGRPGFDPWVGKIPWRRKWQLTPVFLPGKSHGLRSLVGYSLWGRNESDTTERPHFTSQYQKLEISKKKIQLKKNEPLEMKDHSYIISGSNGILKFNYRLLRKNNGTIACKN